MKHSSKLLLFWDEMLILFSESSLLKQFLILSLGTVAPLYFLGVYLLIRSSISYWFACYWYLVLHLFLVYFLRLKSFLKASASLIPSVRLFFKLSNIFELAMFYLRSIGFKLLSYLWISDYWTFAEGSTLLLDVFLTALFNGYMISS